MRKGATEGMKLSGVLNGVIRSDRTADQTGLWRSCGTDAFVSRGAEGESARRESLRQKDKVTVIHPGSAFLRTDVCADLKEANCA